MRGLADIIARSLAGQIASIQVCPGGIVCISFLDLQLKNTYEEAGFISIEDVHCQEVCPTRISFVLVFFFPFEGSNDCLKEALKYLDDMEDFTFQHWTNVLGVATGTLPH